MANENLIDRAMALPLAERVQLAEALWRSIGEGLNAGDERDAIAQAKRRDAELDSGLATGRSHDEVLQAARRAIG